jgi:general L-amino acid transport system substrate-binding protein
MQAWIPSLMRAVGGVCLVAALAGQAPPAAAQGGPIIEAIRARGALVCGTNTNLAGFAQPDNRGVWHGFEVDYCKAIAAAVLGDANKVRFVATTAETGFQALRAGSVDVLARNTTWTLSRDSDLAVDFAGINLYDGQGFMVRAGFPARTARDLNEAKICVQPGTTTERNLVDWAASQRLIFTTVTVDRPDEVAAAFNTRRCDAYTTDISGLAAIRAALPRPREVVILPDVITKEPLGLAVRHGDQNFTDLVRWIHFGLVGAEELGISAASVQQSLASDVRPEVQRMLGRTGDFGRMFGLENGWLVNVLRAVGNYGEVFERNLAPIGLQRGPNELWTNGGLQYSPPFR